MDGSLVELAQRFVPVGETGLHPRRHEAAADERSRGRKRKPYAGQARSGRDRTPRRRFVGCKSKTILKLLQSSPGMRTAAIARPTSAQRSTTDERLKRLQAKGLIERDDASAGW